MKALTKDTLRTIRGSAKRYLSLVAICALGATMLTGLSMACLDLRRAAEALYERQDLFDISVQSTLGLTSDDIDELRQVEGVAAAEGAYQIETYTEVEGLRATVMLKSILTGGMNEPYVVDGRLPEAAGEVAVTENYLHEAGKKLGDTLTFDDAVADDPTGLSDLESTFGDELDGDAAAKDDDPMIPGGSYTIVGCVIDPANITQPEGPVAFRASTSSDYTFFVHPASVADDASYTIAYLDITGTEGLSTYSDAYQERVDEVRERVEALAPQRERARTDEITSDALEGIAEGAQEAEDALSEAAAELDDGQREIDESLAEALEGQRALEAERADALTRLASAQRTIDEQRDALTDGIATAQAGLREIAAARAELLPQLDELDRLASAKEQAAAGVVSANAAVETARAQGDALVAQLKAAGVGDTSQIEATWDALASWEGLLEPAAEEQAFIDAVTDHVTQVSGIADAGHDQLDALGATLQKPLEQREALRDALADLEHAIAQTIGALDALDARIAELEEQLRADPGNTDLKNQLDAARATLTELEAQLASDMEQRDQTSAALQELDEALADYDELAAQVSALDAYVATLDSLLAGTPSQIEQLASGTGLATSGLAQAQAAAARIDAIIAGIDGGIDGARTQLKSGLDALDAAERETLSGIVQAQAGLAALDAGRNELDRERASALTQIDEAARQIQDGLAQIADAQAELDEGRLTLEEERADITQQIADARAKAGDVEGATWYVQDRNGLGSYSSVDSDASSIEAIARVVPAIFFIVAILVSLTTATRMVEEERGLIGLYKALGYPTSRILSKYLAYTASAALIGGIIGDVAGFVVLPNILLSIFRAMYLLPLFTLHMHVGYAALGILAFVAGIAGSTFLTCRSELHEAPAQLMRPRAPRAGSRILLERITPLWRRLGFLNKVTARNLFRYKQRLAMTVFGIMGCTALLICGFSIKNTVGSLAPRQYEQIYRYDLMAVTAPDDFEAASQILDGADNISDIEQIGVDTITVAYGGAKESMQLYVIPRGRTIDEYVALQTLDGAPIDLDDAGVVMTNNAADVLGLRSDDEIEITTSTLDGARTNVAAITMNYLGNAIYMTEDTYEKLFGELEVNGFLAHLTGTDAEQRAFADELESDEVFLAISSVAKMREQSEQSFSLINVVVYVVIGLAAGLAFVVLFTLSTVNIGEREREIATIKVLGFRPSEVQRYINKETFVLTALGILVGLPAGWALSRSFTYILKMPSIYFDVIVAPWCYALAAAFSVVFALAVSMLTNRMLTKITMVDALKSPE